MKNYWLKIHEDRKFMNSMFVTCIDYTDYWTPVVPYETSVDVLPVPDDLSIIGFSITNFGFTIPDDATIEGVSVQIVTSTS